MNTKSRYYNLCELSEKLLYSSCLKGKHQIRKTHILGKLTALKSKFSGELISVSV